MAFVIKFDLSGDQAAAKGIVQGATATEGFAVEPTSNWSAFLIHEER